MYTQDNLSIRQWAEEDRPREKLLLKGRSALSDAELLAILLGSGARNLSAVDLAKLLLQQARQNLHELASMSIHQLMEFRGIGEAKAVTIAAALELGRRRKEAEPIRRPRIASAEDSYRCIYPDLADLNHEEFWVLLLNRANLLLAKQRVSSGSIGGTVADPKAIFRRALEAEASAMILIHNHPSGNTRPSQADIDLTNRMKEAGKWLDLPVLDHLIFTTHQGYYSFAEEGRL